MPDFTLDGLTDEQGAAIQAEIDRRVTAAVQTTTKKVTGDLTAKYEDEYKTKLDTAVATAQAQATMTEEEKIKNLSDQLANQQKEFEKTQMAYYAERKLREAGLTDDAIEKLTPVLIAGASHDSLDATLNSFVEIQKSTVDAALQAQKEQLAQNVQPPAGSGGGSNPSQDPMSTAVTIATNKEADPRYAQASAIQYLFEQSMNPDGV